MCGQLYKFPKYRMKLKITTMTVYDTHYLDKSQELAYTYILCMYVCVRVCIYIYIYIYIHIYTLTHKQMARDLDYRYFFVMI